MAGADHVRIFDLTLREGELSPGASMSLTDKLRLARRIESMGVDAIDAGCPAASPRDFEAVRLISEAVDRCEVSALSRCREKDVAEAWSALQGAAQPMMVLFMAASDGFRLQELRMTPAQALDQIRRGVSAARALCPKVEFSAKDATRADLGFLREVVACAAESGASVVNLADTVGYASPHEYGELVREVVQVVGERGTLVSAHCHNDLGLAVANSLAAVRAGARQIECCINGIGERAGNAALEELVMALSVRRDHFGCTTGVDAEALHGASRLVQQITGLVVQPNKAIVGRNAFAHEVGTHGYGRLSKKPPYALMRPEEVGLATADVVLGKHSDRKALAERLRELGYALDEEEVGGVFERFSRLADKKKRVYDEDLHVLVAGEVYRIPQRYELVAIECTSGSRAVPTAKVEVKVDGDLRRAERSGAGPVAAAIDAIRACVARPSATLEDYALDAITGGADALGRVSLAVEDGEFAARGHAVHTDIVVASALAFVNALNHMVVREDLSARQEGQLIFTRYVERGS